MMYLISLLGLMFVVAVGGVAINPLPQYAAGALVLASGLSCAVLALVGGAFVSIVLFLIYLGGMLVVFAYSVTLVSGSYVVMFGGGSVGVWMFVILCMILYVVAMQVDCPGLGLGGPGEFGGFGDKLSEVQIDLVGVPLVYYSGWAGLVLCIVCLFVCLFVVLGLTRGAGRGGLRVF